jgi:hypothetical protein
MRFNHMELTVPRGMLDEQGGRAEITEFYREIFGWGAIDIPLFEQNNLLLHTDDEVSQFILIAESDTPLTSPGFDHLGMLLDTRAEVDAILEKCERYQRKDDRVSIQRYDDLDQGAVVVHAFYVKFLLPIWFDVQCMEWREGSEPARKWSFG